VRKLGVPGHPEYAMGAISSGGIRVMSGVATDLGVSEREVERVATAEEAELLRQQRAFRGDRPEPGLSDRTVVLVDDGLATGSTMLAAVAAVRRQKPREIVVAVPVGSLEACQRLSEEVDEVVCLWVADPFEAVSEAYVEFGQVEDRAVRALLDEARERGRSRLHG
jgi:putative phosphoribosyl transferase